MQFSLKSVYCLYICIMHTTQPYAHWAEVQYLVYFHKSTTTIWSLLMAKLNAHCMLIIQVCDNAVLYEHSYSCFLALQYRAVLSCSSWLYLKKKKIHNNNNQNERMYEKQNGYLCVWILNGESLLTQNNVWYVAWFDIFLPSIHATPTIVKLGRL